MTRTICPQMTGIYRNNSATTNDRFSYLLIAISKPDTEDATTYAHECDSHGELNPERQFKTIFEAADFGNFVRTI